MKKLLLLLVGFLVGFSTSNAETFYTLLFGPDYNSKGISAYNLSWSASNEGTTWNIQNFNNNNNDKTWNFVRGGSKSAASTAAIINANAWEQEITEIVISAKKNKTGANDKVTSASIQVLASPTSTTPISQLDITAQINGLTTTLTDLTFEVSGVPNAYYRIALECMKATNNGWFELHSVTYNGTEGGSQTSVKTPQFSLGKSAEGYAVTMTCDTEGAEIYYVSSTEAMPTEDPTDASTKYTGPVDVYQNTYFKAVAYLDGQASNVSSFTAEPPYVLENFMPLADFDGNAQVDVRGTITAVYQNGQYLYVADTNNDGMLLYGSNSNTYTNGDSFTGVEGSFTIYKGLPEITNYTLGEKSTGTPVSPKVITLAELTSTPLNSYIKVTGVTINNLKATDGETTVDLYNRFNLTDMDGEDRTIEGFVSKFDTTLQIYPISVTGGEVIETVAEPAIEPHGGELEVGTEITISCETEGATIYYTVDGTEPTAESTEYTAPIVFESAMTLKAIAIKEGMNDSPVATAEFSVFVPTTNNEVTFEFTTDPGTPLEFTEGPVTITFEKAGGSNAPIVNSKAVRFYAKNTLTITLNNGENDQYKNYNLKSVEFTTASGYPFTDATTATNGSEAYGTFDITSNTWTSGDKNGKTLVMTNGGTKQVRIQKMTVSYAIPTGVETIVDTEDVAPVYFNLQGVRVANPENGIFIEVKGNKSRKVYVNK